MSASYSLVSANCLVFFVLFLWQFQNLTLSCCPIYGRQSSDAVKKRFGFSETNTIAYFSLTRVCCCLDSHIFLAFFSRFFFFSFILLLRFFNLFFLWLLLIFFFNVFYVKVWRFLLRFWFATFRTCFAYYFFIFLFVVIVVMLCNLIIFFLLLLSDISLGCF